MSDADRDAVVDPARVACLGNGWHAVLCVRSDGTSWPWLLAPGGRGDDPHGCCCTGCAPHEYPGRPIPREMAERLGGVRQEYTITRCGRPTASGRACRIEVRRPGEACHWHRRGAR